jgi:hypothetical protein
VPGGWATGQTAGGAVAGRLHRRTVARRLHDK